MKKNAAIILFLALTLALGAAYGCGKKAPPQPPDEDAARQE